MKTMLKYLIFMLLGSCQGIYAEEPIDVVIPCHEKDMFTLDMAIDGIKKHGKNVRRVIVVSAKRLTTKAEWFDEKQYPFTKRDLLVEIFGGDMKKLLAFESAPLCRIGWIYQQFLKLYAPFVIPNISANVLVLDSDTVFLKDIAFIDENQKALFDVGDEYHIPYFEHAQKLLKAPDTIVRMFPQYSGICNHMLFQRPILQNLFERIAGTHHTEAWKALCHCIDHKHLFGSTLSEYEMYFNFAFAQFPEKVKIRPLKKQILVFSYKNLSESRVKKEERLKALIRCTQSGYDFVSCHTWIN